MEKEARLHVFCLTSNSSSSRMRRGSGVFSVMDMTRTAASAPRRSFGKKRSSSTGFNLSEKSRNFLNESFSSMNSYSFFEMASVFLSSEGPTMQSCDMSKACPEVFQQTNCMRRESIFERANFRLLQNLELTAQRRLCWCTSDPCLWREDNHIFPPCCVGRARKIDSRIPVPEKRENMYKAKFLKIRVQYLDMLGYETRRSRKFRDCLRDLFFQPIFTKFDPPVCNWQTLCHKEGVLYFAKHGN